MGEAYRCNAKDASGAWASGIRLPPLRLGRLCGKYPSPGALPCPNPPRGAPPNGRRTHRDPGVPGQPSAVRPTARAGPGPAAASALGALPAPGGSVPAGAGRRRVEFLHPAPRRRGAARRGRGAARQARRRRPVRGPVPHRRAALELRLPHRRGYPGLPVCPARPWTGCARPTRPLPSTSSSPSPSACARPWTWSPRPRPAAPG